MPLATGNWSCRDRCLRRSALLLRLSCRPFPAGKGVFVFSEQRGRKLIEVHEENRLFYPAACPAGRLGRGLRKSARPLPHAGTHPCADVRADAGGDACTYGRTDARTYTGTYARADAGIHT